MVPGHTGWSSAQRRQGEEGPQPGPRQTHRPASCAVPALVFTVNTPGRPEPRGSSPSARPSPVHAGGPAGRLPAWSARPEGKGPGERGSPDAEAWPGAEAAGGPLGEDPRALPRGRETPGGPRPAMRGAPRTPVGSGRAAVLSAGLWAESHDNKITWRVRTVTPLCRLGSGGFLFVAGSVRGHSWPASY